MVNAKSKILVNERIKIKKGLDVGIVNKNDKKNVKYSFHKLSSCIVNNYILLLYVKRSNEITCNIYSNTYTDQS